MIFQAMVNMAVAVELLPVTGQTLPLISSGGSSMDDDLFCTWNHH
jgi:cell division protein FtsW